MGYAEPARKALVEWEVVEAESSPHAPQDMMTERVDVSRLSVAECMALGGGAGEPAKEEG